VSSTYTGPTAKSFKHFNWVCLKTQKYIQNTCFNNLKTVSNKKIIKIIYTKIHAYWNTAQIQMPKVTLISNNYLINNS